MKLYVDKNDPTRFQKGMPDAGMIPAPEGYELEDLPFTTITPRDEQEVDWIEYTPKVDGEGNPVWKLDENNNQILDEQGNPIQDTDETIHYKTVTYYDFSKDDALKASTLDAQELSRAEDDMRAQRNALLAETDYYMTIDVHASLTEQQKTDMTNYRQALRDLPANTPDARSVVYPTKPTI